MKHKKDETTWIEFQMNNERNIKSDAEEMNAGKKNVTTPIRIDKNKI